MVMPLPCKQVLPPFLPAHRPSVPPSSLFRLRVSVNESYSVIKPDHRPAEENGTVELRLPVYSSLEVLKRLQCKWSSRERPVYRAMYSSLLGGITLDPALMVLPIDDHMVHRGHGVFDTTMLINGHLYDLDAHLHRFLHSATQAKIPSPHTQKTLRNILIQLAAASNCKTGSIRFWLSAGPGDFHLSPTGCSEPTFYAVVSNQKFSKFNNGVKIITSNVPIKPPLFATMKNVNYLPNVFSKMEAEEKGAFSSIWVDNEGYVAEGPNANVAFISKRKELIFPLSDNILSGCTTMRLRMLASELVETGVLSSVSTRHMTVEEAKESAEMMYLSSLLPILPITVWDEQLIGDGEVGELTLALAGLIWEDIVAGPETRRIRVPYEYEGRC